MSRPARPRVRRRGPSAPPAPDAPAADPTRQGTQQGHATAAPGGRWCAGRVSTRFSVDSGKMSRPNPNERIELLQTDESGEENSPQNSPLRASRGRLGRAVSSPLSPLNGSPYGRNPSGKRKRGADDEQEDDTNSSDRIRSKGESIGLISVISNCVSGVVTQKSGRIYAATATPNLLVDGKAPKEISDFACNQNVHRKLVIATTNRQPQQRAGTNSPRKRQRNDCCSKKKCTECGVAKGRRSFSGGSTVCDCCTKKKCTECGVAKDGEVGDLRQCNSCREMLPRGQFLVGHWRDETSRECLLCEQACKFSELPLDQQQLLESVAEEYDSAHNCRQSDDFNLSLSKCVESGIDLGMAALYTRMNASGFASRLTFPYGSDADYKRILNLIQRATASKPLLTDIKPGSGRTTVSRSIAETMLHKRLQEEELGDQDDPRVPYYKNPNVHSLLENSLQSAESIDVNSDGMHGD
ncbi:hypothetical protein THAOC_02673, partial [Thalassiosira oceanica]